ncbi:MAG TPA: septal ring lytic transglycosylase RlpA family protein [Candidatus Binataceae bacterium]|nr:septal ring lytic transglycosylase RlpA family protein [Candidatus Binataceae bacterium]
MAVGRGRGGELLRRAGLALAISISAAACSLVRSAPPPPAQPPAATQGAPSAPVVGVASWYGPGFDGHRTSSGAVYHEDELTAASMLYALGSRVMVTNLDNGRSVEVTIDDHGPFVKGRKIDLSEKAARLIGMVGPGTARVRIDLLSAPPNSRPIGPPRYYVQVGSFASSSNASRLRDQIATRYPDVHIDSVVAESRRYYRVRMGAFSDRSEAESRAARTARLGLPVVIITE